MKRRMSSLLLVGLAGLALLAGGCCHMNRHNSDKASCCAKVRCCEKPCCNQPSADCPKGDCPRPETKK